MSAPKFYVIDGTSFCYRAYYAIRSLSTSRGEPTNALYGFITMMRKLIAEEKPDYLAMCFDRKEPTFRHERYKEYKAHRKPMPEDLVQQLEPIKEFCRAYRLAIFEQAGFEADDLIGTLARKAEKKKLEVLIVTGDKDAMQLVDERVKILNPHQENKIYDADSVRERFDGLGPEKVVDIMALMGDQSDNIPGVPGVGEKTAVKLIREYGSVENLLKHVNRLATPAQQKLFKENAQLAELSKDLATIDTAVPLEIDWEELKIQPPDEKKLAGLLKHYEFKTLLKEYIPTGEAKAGERRYYVVRHFDEQSEEKSRDLSAAPRDDTFSVGSSPVISYDEFLALLKKQTAVSFDTETTSEDPMRAELVGMSFSWEPFHAYYVPVAPRHFDEQSGVISSPSLVISSGASLGTGSARNLGISPPFGRRNDPLWLEMTRVLQNPAVKKYGQNIKYDYIVMKRTGVEMRGIAFDTMIASYLVNPLKLNHNLDDISLEYLDVKKITTASLIGKGKNQISMRDVPLEKISEYACEDADCVMRLVPILSKKLAEHGLTELFEKVELPLLEVLGAMEMNGVALDLKFLAELSENAGKDLEKLTRKIYREAGEEFNINSTKQLADILFVKLKLPVVKRTKTGYSTDVNVLEKLAAEYELPKLLLEYREKSKLKSTYLDALPEMVNPGTGLIHTSYHQTTTATGRLSSSDPNLQNIPIRTAEGRLIRKAFVPRGRHFERSEKSQRDLSASPRDDNNRRILSADYSQVELRILAHLTGDKNLTAAFNEDRDIHRFTATLLYGVREADVTREMRDAAKTINFSIIYGKTAFGLAGDLGISVGEADGFIENYFARYAAVREYLESQKELARKQGYLTTLLGRRSYFPEIHSKNAQIRAFAERAAINAPIQGSAADLIKLAMIAIQRRLDEDSLSVISSAARNPDKRDLSAPPRDDTPFGPPLMIMQVHDELVFDTPAAESEKLSAMVRREMEGVGARHASPLHLSVPLKVDLFIGDSWYK